MVAGDNLKITGLVASLIVVTGLLMGITNYMGVLGDTFDKDESAITERMNQLNQHENVSRQIQTSKERSQKTGSAISAGVFFLSNIANTFKTSYDSLVTLQVMAEHSVEFLGLPPFLLYIFEGIITLIVSYGAIRIYKGVRP